MDVKTKCCLVILDGWGHGKDPEKSAIAQANTPYMDSLYEKYPNAELMTFGEEVGLPEGQMGNSEVGHLNIGAGRIVFQELARINNAIKDDSFVKNPVLVKALETAKQENKKVHLMGLLSDGGVHSHINHLKALCDVTETMGLNQVYIHAFLDGRDTAPHGGVDYLKDILAYTKDKKVALASIIGRYYAMDRDKRWERTQLAYNLLVNKVANHFTDDPVAKVQEMYDNGITDEFMEAILVDTGGEVQVQRIGDGDVVICFNFRTDRPRQITHVLTQSNIVEYDMYALELDYVSMTNYDESFKGIEVMFTKENLKMTLGEVLEQNNLTQLRAAETEKYPHVTFFFSGGREDAFEGETRIMAPSPKVATYDLQPEMSALELTAKVKAHLKKHSPDFAVINYANTDMVGHTGVFDAAVKAAETVDACVSELISQLIEQDYAVIVIADHGNADVMIKDDGSPHTAHTLSPVPVIVIDKERKPVASGKLADIAPTILKLMGIELPSEMDGVSLIK